MKELSIEEKAKAYDEALKRAIKHHDKDGLTLEQYETIDIIFPELKESKDERIRKEIINYIKTGTYHKDWLAWLEKQGEQKPIIEMKSAEESLGIDSETYNKIVDECICSEQKPADKVEPKFKVGYWIVFNGLTLYIKEVVKGYYRTISKGGIPNSYDWDIDAIARLWTIQDAKDGDVLVASDGSIFIFNSSDNDGCKFHVALTTDNKLVIDHKLKHHWKTSTAIHPATKKQRDTLTKAMLSLGYTFDFDKKELKKIKKESKKIKKESKNSNSYCQEHCKGFQETGKCFADGDCKDKIDAKQDENDEKMIDEIIVDIEVLKEQEMTKYGKELYQEEIDWLKSLKQKIGG